jgi:2-polyprenyl-3-methyl-5-hydroxy-6-metoxy-1,4-benzoquinol methylase
VINSNIQRIVYSVFGTNFYIGSQIKEQIRMLETRIPNRFQYRDLDDLGCGDGKITLRLKEVFKPRRLRGFDVNPALVKRARNNGVAAEIQDLDTSLPFGELAVMWGVLHHLKNREACLRRIQENYSMAFIREPIKNKALKGLEMGQPLIKEEIESLVEKYFQGAQTFYYGHCIFIFYDKNSALVN